MPRRSLRNGILLYPIPILTMVVLRRQTSYIVNLYRNFRHFRNTVKHFNKRRPHPRLLRLNGIYIPVTIRSFFTLNSLRTTPNRLLTYINPTTPIMRSLTMILQSLFSRRTRLIRLQMILPRFIILVTTPLRRLFNGIENGNMRVIPTRVLVRNGMIARNPRSLYGNLNVRLATHITRRNPRGINGTLIKRTRLPTRFTRLSRRINLLIRIARNNDTNYFYDITIRIRLMFHLHLCFYG